MATTITDESMRGMLAASKNYCLMILRQGPKWNQPGADKIIWEHGRRNLRLRAEGVLSIVCPVVDGGDTKGIGIFNASVDETRRVMNEDPGVMAGIFVYEAHLCRSFPGDSLPTISDKTSAPLPG
jgi:hypothetical protein